MMASPFPGQSREPDSDLIDDGTTLHYRRTSHVEVMEPTSQLQLLRNSDIQPPTPKCHQCHQCHQCHA